MQRQGTKGIPLGIVKKFKDNVYPCLNDKKRLLEGTKAKMISITPKPSGSFLNDLTIKTKTDRKLLDNWGAVKRYLNS